MFGYAGRILRVDLKNNLIKEEQLNKSLTKKFIGGYGIGGRILYDEVPRGANPLGSDNRLIFCTGPMTGTLFPGSGRFSVVSKSPLTGYFGDSSCGGLFGPKLKQAGYDFIVISGYAKKPSILIIDDGKVEVKLTPDLWGLDTYETDRECKKMLGDQSYEVACIGPAGENLVKYAAIVSGAGHHVAGRTGLGAVMGSKKLKAVAIRGTKKISIADEKSLNKIYKEVCNAMSKDWGIQMTNKHGTAYFFEMLMELGDTPVRNWNKGTFQASKITGEAMSKTILKGRKSCYLCPEACHRVVSIEEGVYSMAGGGPEYQTVASLGSLCENENLNALAKANDLCNRYGLDTISTGSVIAFAMECFEKGILRKNDIGRDISFGNSDSIIWLIEKITNREGVGDILAEGVRRASEKLGKGSQDFAIHVRGLEVPMHDPRGFYGCGIGYAVGPTGARHTEFLLLETQNPERRYDVKSRAKAVIEETNTIIAINILGLCFKPILGPKDYFEQIVKAYKAVMGVEISSEELKFIGNRVFNLKRAFTLRHGSSIEEDKLPKRLTLQPLPDGPAKGITVPIKEMLEDYYKQQNWDPITGKPNKEKLEELDLKEIADDLWGN